MFQIKYVFRQVEQRVAEMESIQSESELQEGRRKLSGSDIRRNMFVITQLNISFWIHEKTWKKYLKQILIKYKNEISEFKLIFFFIFLITITKTTEQRFSRLPTGRIIPFSLNLFPADATYSLSLHCAII